MLKKLASRTASTGGRQSVFSLFCGTRGLTILCVCLLAIVMLVQVAHTHPFNSDADHCPVCVVMHCAVPVAATVAIILSTPTTAAVSLVTTLPRASIWHFELFNRPPPSNA
jgi:hypothetical protein